MNDIIEGMKTNLIAVLAILFATSVSALGQNSHPHWTVRHLKETCGARRDGKPITQQKQETISICASYIVGVVDGLDGTYQVRPSGGVYQLVVGDYDIAELIDDCMLWIDANHEDDTDASHLIMLVLRGTERAKLLKVERAAK